MKRAISLLLVLVTLLSFAALPAQAASKGKALSELGDILVQVPDNKAKTLEISWYDYGNQPDGYQVYRSTSGKSGTYQKIATLKKTKYTDTGLKNQTVYYYAVRAFQTKGGKTIYSPFIKSSNFTKITKAYARKLLMKAYQVSDDWIYIVNEKNCDWDQYFSIKKKVTFSDGTSEVVELYYSPILHKTITTKEKLKTYLKKYFADYRVDEFVDKFYLEKNGKLYVQSPEWGDGAGQLRDKDQVLDLLQSRYWVNFTVKETWQDPYGTFYDMSMHSLTLLGTRPVFDDDAWFPEAYY